MSAGTTEFSPTHEDLDGIVGDLVQTLDELPATATPGSTTRDPRRLRAQVEIRGACLVEVRLDLDGARALAQAMFGLGPGPTGDSDLRDAVGEIANIVAGNTKSLAAESDLSLGLPRTDLVQAEAVPPGTGPTTTHTWRGHDIHVIIHPPGEKP